MATVKIGHASISENGTTSGKAGDQTGKEVCIRDWYDKQWDFMAIHPDAKVREKHAKAVEAACINDNIGYNWFGENDRNSLNKLAKAVSYDLSKVGKCNCDCSSLQNVAAVASGSGATYGSNGWTTSTMKAALQKLGYKIITTATYLKSSAYCVRGAIYVKSSSHTVCGLTNGSKAQDTLKKAGITTAEKDTSSTTKKETDTKKTTTSSSSVKIDPADKFNKSLAGKYKTTAALNLRAGAGTSKKVLIIIPKGSKVQNYGYYTLVGSTKWLYVQYTTGGKTYTGFCSSKYLMK